MAALVAAALLATTGRSRAEPVAPEEAEPPSTELERTFTILAANERTHRAFKDGVALTVGAAAMAGGIVLAFRDKGADGPYVLAGIGGLRILTASYDLLRGRGAYERLLDALTSMRSAQLPEPELLHRVDASWRQEAKRSRSARVRSGVVESVLGVLLVGAGTLLAFDQDLFDVSASERTVRVQALVGVGSLLTAGVAHLVLREPVEVGHEIFRSKTADTAGLRSSAPSFAIGVRGPGLSAAMTFQERSDRVLGTRSDVSIARGPVQAGLEVDCGAPIE